MNLPRAIDTEPRSVRCADLYNNPGISSIWMSAKLYAARWHARTIRGAGCSSGQSAETRPPNARLTIAPACHQPHLTASRRGGASAAYLPVTVESRNLSLDLDQSPMTWQGFQWRLLALHP